MNLMMTRTYSQGQDLRSHYKDGRAWKKEKDKKLKGCEPFFFPPSPLLASFYPFPPFSSFLFVLTFFRTQGYPSGGRGVLSFGP